MIVHSARFGAQMPEALPLLQTQSEQSAGTAIDLMLQLAIGVTQRLVADDERLVIRVLIDDLIEHVADGQAQQ